MARTARLASTPSPVIEIPQVPAPLSVALYQQRIAEAIRRAKANDLDVLAIYADREHFANLAYLTGVDPRFEEALLLLNIDGRSLLLLGDLTGWLPPYLLDLSRAFVCG